MAEFRQDRRRRRRHDGFGDRADVRAVGPSDAAVATCRATLAERAIERLHGVLDRGLPRGFWSETAAETARRQLSVAEASKLTRTAISSLRLSSRTRPEARSFQEAGRDPCARSWTCLEHIVHLDHEPERGARRAATSPFRGHAFLLARLSDAACRGHPGRRHRSGLCRRRREAMVAIGKTPIRVKDVVGFAVNRLLHALVLESIRLVEEGVCSPADIDLGLQARPWSPDRTV